MSHEATAVNAAYYCMEYCSLSLPELYQQLCPSVQSQEEEIVPCNFYSTNVAIEKYRDIWSVQGVEGLRVWLKVIRFLKEVMKLNVKYLLDWGHFFKIMQKSLPILQMSEYSIPIILPHGNTVDCRLVQLTDYLSYYPTLTPSGFFNHILQTIIFGFVVNDWSIGGLRIEGVIGRYIELRLQNGVYMTRKLISRGNKRTSSETNMEVETKKIKV